MLEQDHRLASHRELTLHARLTDADYVEQLWQACSQAEQDVARLFLFQAAQGFLTKKEWDRLAARQVRFALGLTRLRRLGFVFTVRKLWSEVGYMMPQEIREILITRLVRQKGKEKALESSSDHQALSYYIAAGRGIHLDLFGMLLYMREHEIPLTQRKTIHRRVLQKLEHRFSLQAAHVDEWFNRYYPPPIKESYQPETAIILDLALRLGLLRLEQARICIAMDAVAEWLACPAAVRFGREWQIITDAYLPCEPWFEAYAILMKQHVGEQWINSDELLVQLRELGYALPDDAPKQLLKNWLHPLLGLGWIQLGEFAERTYWRWNPLIRRESEDGWYVQPTGEMIIPPLVSLKKLWELSKIAEITFDGEWIRAALDPKRLQSYVSRGANWQDALAFLQEGSAYPIPVEAQQLLRRWSEQARQIHLEHVVRVRVAEPRLLDDMLQIPMLAPYLGERISPTEMLVAVDAQQDLADALRRCGYEAVLSEPQRHAEQAAAGTSGENIGLFDATGQLAGYQVENTFPDADESLGQLRALPKMWTSHYQAYHPQTLRDLCKRAVELGLSIRIELTNGSQWTGIPLRLEVDMGYWVLTLENGRRRNSCRLEEISRAQIILPEYL